MEKRDAAVALVGGLILLVALAGAGYSSRFDAGAPFLVTYEMDELRLGQGNQAHFGEDSFTDAFSFAVKERNVTTLHVNATVAFLGTGGEGGATAHARLLAPDRSEVFSGEMTPPGGHQEVVFEIVVPIATPPGPSVVRATDADAAVAAAGFRDETAIGTWTLEVSFSSGVVPANSATVAWSATANHWRAHAEPAPDEAR